MAEDQDQSQKTEEPTEKKLEDAHKKGDVVKSREVGHWFMLVAMTLAMLVSAGPAASLLTESFKGLIANSGQIAVEGDHMMELTANMMWKTGVAFILPVLFFVVAALAGTMVQHKPVFTGERMKPELSKISVTKGFKRLFSSQSIVEFLKTLAKFVIVAAAVALLVAPEAARLEEITTYDVATILPLVQEMAVRMLIGVAAIMAIIAGLDFLYQNFQHRKKMRMTKQEIKDEYKQTDGDPHVKGKLRQLRQERSRQRMMAAVPEADVVVTNPTHFAVAMKYDGDTMDAPRVVAKGADHVAAKIRELATEHSIPIVENPPLARALYAAVDIDSEITPEHYKAVAEVISYVMRLRHKAGKRR